MPLQKSKKIQSKSLRQPAKKIAVCGCGTPLIFTFVFPFNEYWCPDCESKFGMMGAQKTTLTPELKFMHVINLAASKKYLDAVGVFTCSSMTIKGVQVQNKDIPEHIKIRAKKVINEFKSRSHAN